MTKNNLTEEIKKRVKDAKDSLDVSLNPNDPTLIEQMSLGEDWDDPERLAKALDMHSLWRARWSKMLKTLRGEKEKLENKYKTWESIKKEEIYDELFQGNIDEGMTANNAKPTNTTVERRFQKDYVDPEAESHKEYQNHKKPLDILNQRIDNISVVVEAFDARTQMLIQLSGLLRSMIDNKIYIPKKSKKANE